MFGNNPKKPPENGDGTSLKVQSIFLTIQGEGPYSGVPAIFLRLGGCNLACSFCDTEFEQYSDMALGEIMEKILSYQENSPAKLVVITGGEPFRQKLAPICNELIKNNFKIQIETNGTLYNEVPEQVDVVCSPKIVNNRYYGISAGLKKHIVAYKFLISERLVAYDKIADWEFAEARIYVQAMDEYDIVQNSKNQKLAMDLAIKNGYSLSVQLHKILGIE